MILDELQRGKDLLLDANLLLLFLVGRVEGSDGIKKCKRLNAYTESDYELIASLVSLSHSIITTPNILTEVSNLGQSVRHYENFTRELVKWSCEIKEEYIETRSLHGSKLVELGITDAGFLLLNSNVIILTADFPLYLNLLKLKRSVYNFSHIRFQ